MRLVVHGACEAWRCGDGVRNGAETCEGDDLGGATCLDLGFTNPDGLRCTDDCRLDRTACTGGCGDGIRDDNELCDGADLSGADCTTAGFYDAAGLACSPFCTYDVSACTGFCGDREINGDEACDGRVVPGDSCAARGFESGVLGCASCGSTDGACVRQAWVRAPLPTLVSRDLYGVWGAGPDDVYAVGELAILHWTGAVWEDMTPLNSSTLYGVWGTGPDDVFAVGLGGRVFHWNGASWTRMTTPTTRALTGVWGAGPDDVFAVGAFGTILHWDGVAWSTMSSGTTTHLAAIWGSSSNDVYAVGAGGEIRRWNGISWASVGSGTSEDLFAIWGTSATHVVVVGDQGTIRRWNGASWTAMTAASSDYLTAIWGFGPGTTAGGTTELLRTACDPWLRSGRERTYRLEPAADGPITLTLTGLTRDLDLVVLASAAEGGCNPHNPGCVGASASPGTTDESVTFQARAGATYWIAVDGYGTGSSGFELAASCP